ncbi:glycosyltransferase family 9 protein [Alteromonas pelagimontana]|uniref:Glycosyltransferase family 9 protein n=1 Tax=Alteromonas pelagimontana TaxID=1858656 RepID=A0A6M4MCX6_9ALTE|nr:glycosyltransferase family 9 protein [Alteromonas pelagimontana]QJR81031.1 glycosyltransferase family 9 protein [Alteromonas pelagimontana]
MYKNIVVMLPNYLGDAVMSTPSLQLLQELHSQASITLLCVNSATAELFGRESRYRVLRDPRSSQRAKGFFPLVNMLRKERFDLGILFRNTFLDALAFKLAGVKQVVGYKKEGRSFLLHHKEKMNSARHYINHFAHLVNAAHGNEKRLLYSTQITARGDALTFSTSLSTFYVGIYLGGKNKGVRHYPHSLAIEAVKPLIEAYQLHFVLLGDQQEREDNANFQVALTEIGAESTNLAGETDIHRFVDTIAALDLLLTIDSSPLHIAAAVNTPAVVLVAVGTSAWSRVVPKTAFGEAVLSPGNSVRDQDQMSEIDPENVTAALKRQLNALMQK